MKKFKFKNNFVAFVLISIYSIVCILNAVILEFNFLKIINTFLELIPIFLILCFLDLENKDFKFKKHMVSFAFGLIVIRNLYNVIISIVTIPKYLQLSDFAKISFVFTVVLLLFNVLCFIGAVLNFKYKPLLKAGCVGYIATLIIMNIYEFFSLGGMAYINSVPEGISPINIMPMIKLISIFMFYIGVFVADLKKEGNDDK